jgi:hypothetical protein
MGWYMYKVFIVRKDTKKFIYLLPPCKSKACVWHESAANWKQILMLMSERWYNNGNQSSQVTTPNGSCVPFATCFWASSGLLFLHLLQATNYGPFLEVEMRQNHHDLVSTTAQGPILIAISTLQMQELTVENIQHTFLTAFSTFGRWPSIHIEWGWYEIRWFRNDWATKRANSSRYYLILM